MVRSRPFDKHRAVSSRTAPHLIARLLPIVVSIAAGIAGVLRVSHLGDGIQIDDADVPGAADANDCK